MHDVMQEIHERASLAGTNRLEVLMFKLNQKEGETSQLFGINVFKVKELVSVPPLRTIPRSPKHMKGLASIRGVPVPVIDLMEYCGFQSKTPANILILTEYNNSSQGFLVHDVDNIALLDWADILEPPPLFNGIDATVVTGISELDDKQILLILDVEKILADVLGPIEEKKGSTIDMASEGSLKGKTVFFADDSALARRQVGAVLTRMGAEMIIATDGGQAWSKLQGIATKAEADEQPITNYIDLIISDVEMPRMDGYMLTKNIKSDSRFANIPVIMHTSLSSESNRLLGENVGVDSYVAKLDPKKLSDKLEHFLLNKKNV